MHHVCAQCTSIFFFNLPPRGAINFYFVFTPSSSRKLMTSWILTSTCDTLLNSITDTSLSTYNLDINKNFVFYVIEIGATRSKRRGREPERFGTSQIFGKDRSLPDRSTCCVRVCVRCTRNSHVKGSGTCETPSGSWVVQCINRRPLKSLSP